MATKIGLIQSRGIGDIIIALPIADFYIENGHEVYWPIDARFVAGFREVKPEVNFIPVEEEPGFFLETPLRKLQETGCQRTIMLYSFLTGHKVANEPLARSLKFDEYKYAVAEVPFSRKWNLRLRRNPGREMALHQRLGITREYVCFHTSGSNFNLNLTAPPEWQERYQIIQIRELTDNPFDWLYTLEHASKLVLLDSCFSNLVEQMNLPVEKYLILRSPVGFTPVMINNWKYAVVNAH